MFEHITMCHCVDNSVHGMLVTGDSCDHTLVVPGPTLRAEENHLPGHTRSLSVEVWTPAGEDVFTCASVVITLIATIKK